ncbi:MAG: helix-turn-helix domain-containing protein [Variovorax sp.]|nr:helix-turn-helix domain-containing protein [Variovorax sp.]
MKALEEAICIAGGASALASRIGVATSAPGMWKRRRSVPAEHCPAIERETGVTCERLRAGVAWDVLRRNAAIVVTRREGSIA